MKIEKEFVVTCVSFQSGLMTLELVKPTQSLCLVLDKTNAKALKIPWTADLVGVVYVVSINLQYLKRRAGKYDLVVCFATSVEEVAWRPGTPCNLGLVGTLHSREVALASKGAISNRAPFISYRLGVSENEYKSLCSLGYNRKIIFNLELSQIG